MLHRRRARGAAAANLAELRAAGVETLVAVGLFVQGELLGALVLASRRAGRHRHRRRRAARAARHPRRRVPAHRRADGLAARARRDRPAHRPRPPRDLPRGPGRIAPAADHRRRRVRHRRLQAAQRHLRPRPRRSRALRRRRRHEQRAAPRRPALPRRRRRVRRACSPSSRREQALGAALRLRDAVAGGAAGGHGLHRGRRPARGRDRRRAAGARRPGAVLGQGGRARRRRAGQRRAAAGARPPWAER